MVTTAEVERATALEKSISSSSKCLRFAALKLSRDESQKRQLTIQIQGLYNKIELLRGGNSIGNGNGNGNGKGTAIVAERPSTVSPERARLNVLAARLYDDQQAHASTSAPSKPSLHVQANEALHTNGHSDQSMRVTIPSPSKPLPSLPTPVAASPQPRSMRSPSENSRQPFPANISSSSTSPSPSTSASISITTPQERYAAGVEGLIPLARLYVKEGVQYDEKENYTKALELYHKAIACYRLYIHHTAGANMDRIKPSAINGFRQASPTVLVVLRADLLDYHLRDTRAYVANPASGHLPYAIPLSPIQTTIAASTPQKHKKRSFIKKLLGIKPKPVAGLPVVIQTGYAYAPQTPVAYAGSPASVSSATPVGTPGQSPFSAYTPFDDAALKAATELFEREAGANKEELAKQGQTLEEMKAMLERLTREEEQRRQKTVMNVAAENNGFKLAATAILEKLRQRRKREESQLSPTAESQTSSTFEDQADFDDEDGDDDASSSHADLPTSRFSPTVEVDESNSQVSPTAECSQGSDKLQALLSAATCSDEELDGSFADSDGGLLYLTEPQDELPSVPSAPMKPRPPPPSRLPSKRREEQEASMLVLEEPLLSEEALRAKRSVAQVGTNIEERRLEMNSTESGIQTEKPTDYPSHQVPRSAPVPPPPPPPPMLLLPKLSPGAPPPPPPPPAPTMLSKPRHAAGVPSPPPPPPPPPGLLKPISGAVPMPPPPPPPPMGGLPLLKKGPSGPPPPPPPPIPASLVKKSVDDEDFEWGKGPPAPPAPSMNGNAPAGDEDDWAKSNMVLKLYRDLNRPMGLGQGGGVIIQKSARPEDAGGLMDEMLGKSNYAKVRVAFEQAVQEDVERYAGMIEKLAVEVKKLRAADMSEAEAFVQEMNKRLDKLTDEAAVLKHFEWPEAKADSLREAVALHKDLTSKREALLQVGGVGSAAVSRIDDALTRITNIFENVQKKVETFQRSQDATKKRFSEHGIPFDFNIVKRLQRASSKAAGAYLRRVLDEVTGGNCSQEKAYSLLVSAVRFTFRVHQFGGGLDKATLNAFEEASVLLQEVAENTSEQQQQQK
eukprot:jgi/Chlat1/3076/Chrsp21S03329